MSDSVAIDTPPLTWDECVAMAREHHPELVSALSLVAQSEAGKSITRGALLPQIDGDLGVSRQWTGSSTGSSGTASTISSAGTTRSDDYSYGVSGSQLVFDGFSTLWDLEQAAKTINADRFNYDVVSSDVRLNLRVAFVGLLRAQESLRLAERIEKRRLQSRDLIQLRYDAGREHRGSLLTAEANLAQAAFDSAQARRSIRLSQRRLATSMGLSGSEPLGVQGSLDAVFAVEDRPDFDQLAQTTPFLRRLVVLKEAARLGVRSFEAGFFPKVYATASAGRDGGEWPPEREGWGVGASVSMPFFEGGSRVAELARRRATVDQAEAEEKSGLNGVLLTLEEAWTAFRDAADNVSVQEKFLAAAQERGKIAEAEYSTGLISFNDWIIIEDNLVRAEKTYLTARAEALNAEAGWRQAKGDTLDVG